MSKTVYIEDLFLDFIKTSSKIGSSLEEPDFSASINFLSILRDQKQLTENQGKYLLKILEKNKKVLEHLNIDLDDKDISLVWKNKFRVIDQTRSIDVEIDHEGETWILLKMPYTLKNQLENFLNLKNKDYHASIWDSERQLRKLKLQKTNLIHLDEFAIAHNFKRTDNFLKILSEIEQIWQDQEELIPRSEVIDDRVVLINASLDAVDYWNTNKTNDLFKDLFLAKSMGFSFRGNLAKNKILEKICSNSINSFWFKSLENFFDFYKSINDLTVVIVGKDESSLTWVKGFVDQARNSNISENDIKICFRLGKNEDTTNFNQWVRDKNLGGKAEEGKILIFQNKPAKWVFSKEKNVKIILTNSLYPIPSNLTQDWMEYHPCVCFAGEMKASQTRNKKIVEL